MGFGTVAVVAPGDEDARHVTYADRVAEIPSYLDAAAIVKAAREAGARVIHPGYGFLSERPHFVAAVEAAGIAFAGPTAESMERLGGKIEAKRLAEAEGVPTLPWARVETGAEIGVTAKKVGFPLLLKAAAGGGGKGMRRVDRAGDLAPAAESAAAESVAAFGDGTLFLERLVERPRHIEVQVFGDGRGGACHLHERECSLQRRHQKIWEEAPAPNLPEATRAGLLAAALKLARAVKYRSAGTVEFLVDPSGAFFFLEMNTRLQVEHPVTEMVTGVDLVRAQLELALDPRASPLRETPVARGVSIEARLYSEDPYQDYVPTPGKIERLRWPTGAGIRIESGIEEGQVIGTGFDAMLAKIVVHAADRAHAIARLQFALQESVVLGPGTNQRFLLELCGHLEVRSGNVHTGFLEQKFSSPEPGPDDLGLWAAARAAGLGRSAEPGHGTGESPSAWPSPWSVM